MASTIDKLYSKYAGRVQRYMEDDAYYQYLLELIGGGKTTITQHNRVLDKIVDETWLTAIEAALPAIHEIIAHPRKFLKTAENLVPVEKAKKIGTDSVRHLASHTQYISGIRGGMIYPGKILTVENEESIDLYENRFVATLIKKVSEFIEKRTAAIFWDTGDEQQSILKVESQVEDDYEEIEYRLEMIVKNKQTYMENDNSKMDIFKRIDRARRVMTDFRASTFMQVMSSAPAVRAPIQRTNQLTKNPDYRACFDLWQFLERYDAVGYRIDVRETALDFDEDYLFQMYGNVAMNYTVFKSLLEHDDRRITETPKRRKTIRPKFVKQIVEEFVDDYDIPDVEIRKVIVEEVTRAQVEIERRTREQEAQQEKIRLAKEKEQEKRQAEKAKQDAKKAAEKAKLAAQKAAEKEKVRLAAQKEKEKARLAAQKEKERAKLAAQKAAEKEKARLAAQKEKEKARLAAQKEKERAKLAAQKAAEKEKARLAAQKEKEKTRLAAQKEKERAKLAAQKAAEKEKARLAAEKEKEKAKLAAQKAADQKKSKPTAPKKSHSRTVEGAEKAPTAQPVTMEPVPSAGASVQTEEAPAPVAVERPDLLPPPAEEERRAESVMRPSELGPEQEAPVKPAEEPKHLSWLERIRRRNQK